MFKKMLKKFLGIDELENELTEIDKRLANNIDDTECNRTDIEDKPSFYDLQTEIENMVDENIEDVLERLDKLENFFAKWEDFLKEDK
jgi:3-polyprenyl-4-hydroxybenzoate decarboxylase